MGVWPPACARIDEIEASVVPTTTTNHKYVLFPIIFNPKEAMQTAPDSKMAGLAQVRRQDSKPRFLLESTEVSFLPASSSHGMTAPRPGGVGIGLVGLPQEAGPVLAALLGQTGE